MAILCPFLIVMFLQTTYMNMLEKLKVDTVTSKCLTSIRFRFFLKLPYIDTYNIYPGNNMCQKCGQKSGLWVLHEIVNKIYAENLKKIVGARCRAVWELPAT